MPLYQYECSKCHLQFDAWNKIKDRQTTTCTKCRGVAQKRISAPNFSFGWKLSEASSIKGHRDELVRDV